MTEGFGPKVQGFDHFNFGDHKTLKNLINKKTAAIMVETIMGEGGIKVIPDWCLKGLRQLCTKKKILLIMDEVQSGIGRTGDFFAFEKSKIKPDIVPIAIGIGGGFPIGAVLMTKKISSAMIPGSHGSTFGGNPLASKIALKAIDLLFEEKLIENSKKMGEYFLTSLRQIDSKIIKEVRGKGLWIGMELNKSDVNAKDLCLMLLNEGLLCKETHKTVIRFAPPLMISKEDLDWAINKITKVIRAI